MDQTTADAPQPPPMSPGVSATRELLRNRDFVLFVLTRFLSTVGLQVESVTIGWQVYAVARLSRSVEEGALLVGMVGLIQFLPVFALTLIAGETADRFTRKYVVLAAIAVEIVVVAVLSVLALHPSPSLTAVFVAAGLFGAARAFLSPANSAIGPMLVERRLLPRAIAWTSLSWQAGSITGPFVGGLLCAVGFAQLAFLPFGETLIAALVDADVPSAGVGPGLGYAGAAVLYLAAALCLTAIRHDTTPERQAGSRLALIREGLEYVWTNKIVLGAISLDLFAVLLGGATALLPVFARDVLNVGPEGFGVLRAGPAIGAAVMAVILARWPIHSRAGAWMFGGVAVFGAATIVFGLSQTLWLSVLALAILGAADMISVYVRQTLVQIVTPDRMRGRVSAASGLFVGASNELGEFESGVAARFLGPVGAALFGGVGALAVTGVWAKLFPQLRRADRLE